MRQAYDESKKKSICLEVKNLQDENKSSLSDILAGICKKYNVGTGEVYSWNKKFGMIFDNNLFSKEEKFQICYIVAEPILCNVSIAEAVSLLAQKNVLKSMQSINGIESLNFLRHQRNIPMKKRKIFVVRLRFLQMGQIIPHLQCV